MVEMILPRLYAIIDAEVCQAHSVTIAHMAQQLAAAGVTLVQYRDKQGSPQEILANAAILRHAFGRTATLIMNDRVDLALLAGFDGVHLGQGDTLPDDAGRIAAITRPEFVIGVSTHTQNQVTIAEFSWGEYIAIGPVFATSTKLNAEPVVGLEGVRMARDHTIHQLVAIGGITRQNTRSVIAAGADSIAVISAFFAPNESIEQVARDFLHILS